MMSEDSYNGQALGLAQFCNVVVQASASRKVSDAPSTGLVQLMVPDSPAILGGFLQTPWLSHHQL